MADIQRRVVVIFDRTSAERVGEQFERTLKDAGEQGGKGFYRALQQTFKQVEAELKELRAAGLIDDKEHKRRLDAASRAYNDTLIRAMERARQAGQLTEKEYQKLARTLKTVGDDGSKSANVLAMAWNRVALAAAAAFSARAIVNGVRDLFRSAIEADAVWNRLSGTLDNVGVKFEDVRSLIEGQAKALQATTRVGDEEYAEVLNTLVTISGDFASSLENVQLVADLAARKQIDLGTAAELVGKVMVGETGTLKRYGIVVQEGADAMQLLRDRMAGAAENEGNTLAGKLDQLNNAWGDFKEAAGGALINITSALGILDAMLGLVNRLTRAMSRLEFAALSARLAWAQVTRNAAAIEAASKALADLEIRRQQEQRDPLRADDQREVVALQAAEARRKADEDKRRKAAEDAAKKAEEARKERERAIEAEVRGLKQLAEMGVLREQDAVRALELEKQFRAEINATNTSIARRAELTQRIRDLTPASDRARAAGMLDGARPGFGIVDTGGPDLQTVRLENTVEQQRKAAERVQTAWTDAADIIADSFENRVSVVAGALEALATGGIRGLAKYASAKAKEALALAAGATARGLIALASPVSSALLGEKPGVHFAAAAKFLAEAALWKGLGAATGGGGGNAGGGAPSVGAANTGAAREAQPKSELHITFVGEGFEAVNPKVQQVVMGAIQEGSRRVGPNGKVRVYQRRA